MRDLDRTFNAIDVETANSDRASICQIGIVHVVEGEIRDTWSSYINPEDWFDHWNVKVHGITENMVASSPTMLDVSGELERRLNGSTVVSHTSFDRVALDRTMLKYDLPLLQAFWLDSAMVARRTWPKFSKRGYGLRNVANDLRIEFKHHDALEDARASALILLSAINETGRGIQEWQERTRRRVNIPRESTSYEDLRGRIKGNLSGETLVFTGVLEMPRAEAIQKAEQAGCVVASSVSSRVSILVIGTQDKHRLKGMSKSTKHRRAEALSAEGHDIQIISERDFLELINPS